MAEQNRPTGVTIVAVLLLLTALNGLRTIIGFDGGRPLSEWLADASALDYFNAGFGLTYVFLAALSAIGLWEMRGWALLAYACWAALAVIGLALKDAMLKLQGVTDSAWWLIAIGPIVVGVVLAIVGLALNRSLKNSA
jgi:hypothetical protein